MNTINGIENVKSFQIILDSGCSSMIVMVRLVEKLNTYKDAVMQWHTQAGNITTNNKVKIYFTFPVIITTNVVMWKCHVYKYAKGRYYMILGCYILT